MWKHNFLFKLQVQHREQPRQWILLGNPDICPPQRLGSSLWLPTPTGGTVRDIRTITKALVTWSFVQEGKSTSSVRGRLSASRRAIFLVFQFRVYNGGRGSEPAAYAWVVGSQGTQKSLGNQLNRHAEEFLQCEENNRGSRIIRKEDRSRLILRWHCFLGLKKKLA